MFNIDRQKFKFLHLSELVRRHFDLIFDRRVRVIYVDCFGIFFLKKGKTTLNMQLKAQAF